MAARQVVALGGGGFGEAVAADRGLEDGLLALTGRDEPRVCFVPTASGDADAYVATMQDALAGRARFAVLRLFNREVADLDAFLAEQDLVYVGGGSTVNLLAVWRAHGLDAALRRAYERGVVMAGVSAGANCWFQRCTTDSWRVGRADGLRDGLGWLSGGFCPHYRSEPARRPQLHRLVDGGFGDTYAVDDGCALHLVDEQLVGPLASRPDASAFVVRRTDDDRVVEDEVPAQRARDVSGEA
ncbi:Type 1 glutamine amidotransferase-like domain-containing protein [Microlunatus flavus]|uniref:Peptidase E n=1 Tax=Microlunatus flavus TaxID=1036181 RepID=A0A1H8Z2P7_9ACTN|nr:peptidase E [Microlunatus flavus]SEP58704.1 Peptidase E [Microlunatus flavus]